jgi:putative toxin-antitoxin system toxin component, PIN family
MTVKSKIIIDTNLWISFLLSRKFNFLDSLLDVEELQLIFSKELLEEIMEVTSRSKLKKFLKKEDLKLIFDIIERYAILIPVTSDVTECRDKKDNFLLSLAKDSKADYLLTGDKDLLVLKESHHTQIITISDFQTMLQKK